MRRMNTVYERLGQLSKDDPEILVKIADYYAVSKQIKEAIPRYLAILKMRPGASDDSAVANVREKLARSLIFTSQRDEAIEVLEGMVKENPQRFDTLRTAG